MRFVHAALRNVHRDQPVWVVGADRTLGQYPSDFLDDKLSIILGSAFKAFPNGTYNYNDEHKTLTALWSGGFSEYFTKPHIWAYPFFGMSREQSRKFVEAHSVAEAWHLNYKPYPPRGYRNDILSDRGYDAMIALVHRANQGDPGPYGGFGTCLHCALYSAIIMGCNPINIIACSHRIIDGYYHAPELDGVPSTPQQIAAATKDMRSFNERGTQAIMEGCRREGIEVIRWGKFVRGEA